MGQRVAEVLGASLVLTRWPLEIFSSARTGAGWRWYYTSQGSGSREVPPHPAAGSVGVAHLPGGQVQGQVIIKTIKTVHGFFTCAYTITVG